MIPAIRVSTVASAAPVSRARRKTPHVPPPPQQGCEVGSRSSPKKLRLVRAERQHDVALAKDTVTWWHMVMATMTGTDLACVWWLENSTEECDDVEAEAAQGGSAEAIRDKRRVGSVKRHSAFGRDGADGMRKHMMERVRGEADMNECSMSVTARGEMAVRGRQGTARKNGGDGA